MNRVLCNRLSGERPSAVRMRVIGAPHDVAVAEELDQVQSDKIRLVGRPHLAFENFARHRFQWNILGFLPFELSPVAVVHLLDDEWNPADSRLGKAKFQFRMPFQRSKVEEIYKRIEEGSRAVAQPHVESHLALIGLERVHRGPDRTRLNTAADMVRN